MTTEKKEATTAMRGCMRASIRVLCCVRDFYVKSITRCAGQVQHEAAALNGYGYPSLSEASYSFNTTSNGSEEDLRELIRAGSLTRAQSFDHEAKAKAEAKGKEKEAESHEVIGRIDEEEACEFAEEDVKVGANLLTSRSRSSAIGPGLRARKRKAGMFCM